MLQGMGRGAPPPEARLSKQVGRSLGEVGLWGLRRPHLVSELSREARKLGLIARPCFQMPCRERTQPAKKVLDMSQDKKETLTMNLETTPRSHPACCTHLVSALGLASTPSPYLASSSFLFVSLTLFIPPMFIIFYEPTLLFHPGDATIREEKKKQCLHPSESHGL